MKKEKKFNLSIFRTLRERAGKKPQDCARELGLMRNEYDRLEDHQQGHRYLVLLMRHMKACNVKKSELWKLIEQLHELE